MKTTMKNMLAVVSVLAVAGSASAAAIWTGGAGAGNWDTASNWDIGVPVPGAFAGVTIDTVGAVVTKVAGADAFAIGDLFVNNGDLNVQGHVGGGMLRLANFGAANSATLTIESGDGSFAGWKSIDMWGASIGEGGGTGSFVNNGGTAKMALEGAWFILAPTGAMNLNGGYTIFDIDAADDSPLAGQFFFDGVMDLAGGAVAFKGDVLTEAGGWILGGNLTSFGQTADLSDYLTKFAFDYDETNTGYTTITAIPEPATLSMVALLGGGILWIRRRFMI